MYDAINRGLRRASGDILAHLNCDEQYLPGALGVVHDYFEKHRDVEMLFAEGIIVDVNGDYMAHRHVCVPTLYHTMVGPGLLVLTCATFFRRSVIDKHKVFFDPKFKNIGDAEWMARVIAAGVRFGHMKAFTSVYTYTGNNLSLSSAAPRERRDMAASAPWWLRHARPLLTLQYQFRRLVAGHFRQLPAFDYAIYTMKSPGARLVKRAERPTFRWPAVMLTGVKDMPAEAR